MTKPDIDLSPADDVSTQNVARRVAELSVRLTLPVWLPAFVSAIAANRDRLAKERDEANALAQLLSAAIARAEKAEAERDEARRLLGAMT
jgi:hypothetical protein